MIRKFLISVCFAFACFSANAQDTISLMHYNLLNYGNDYEGCTQNSNNIDTKATHLSLIFSTCKPDVLTVNELACNASVAQHLLDNALNVDGESDYRLADLTCQSTPYLSNTLYYNLRKVRFHSSEVITTTVRDINIFKMYYYSNDLLAGDTAFFHCVVAHLKAGSDAADKTQRATETAALMSELSQNDYENVILLGDFNVRASTETSFQNLINDSDPGLRFYDPINQLGSWNSNASFAGIHTQSTHNTSGCAAGGGMDDRFDFILISKEVKDGTTNFIYVPDSYEAIGQDGQHFNKALTDSPENSMVSSSLVNALYGASDHLPVRLKLRVNKTLAIDDLSSSLAFNLNMASYFRNEIRFRLEGISGLSNANIRLYDILGNQVLNLENQEIFIGEDITFNTSHLNSGIYILVITDKQLGSLSKKLVKF